MADTQGLFDALAGASGHGIDRAGLNNFVATSQARNGLVSAQTQDAMLKAQQASEELDAHQKLADSLIGAGQKPSDAYLTRDLLVGHFGDAQTALKAVGQLKLGYGSPTDQTSGQQMAQGKVAEPVAVPPTYTTLPGATPPNVQMTPQGQAQLADTQSQTALRTAQANAGGFNPHNGQQGGPMDPQAIAFGAYMLYKTGKMPPLGMGAGPARSAILTGASQLAQQEAQGQPVSNPGYDTAIQNGQDYSGAGRAINSFAGGPIGNQVRSLNNVVGHLGLMENLFTALQNGDMQALNKLNAAWQKQFGSPAPTNIQVAANVIGPELTKILSGNASAGTGPEREHFAETAGNLANAPEQTGGAIQTLKGMLGRQAADL